MYEPSNVIKLNFVDLSWSFGMMAIAIALSNWQELGLEKQLLLATGRAFLQLLALGYLISTIFNLNHPIPILTVLGVMLLIAAKVTQERIDYNGRSFFFIISGSLLISNLFTLSYVFYLIVHLQVWYSPQYLIPLAGMILGNAMNSAALSGQHLIKSIRHNQREIETYLCLGATPRQAITSYKHESIRISLIPILNQMMVVGIVSLPEMFAGQVLGGSNPSDASSHQILILFMIVLTNMLTSILVTEGVYRQCFNENSQLTI
ncbi:MAG: TIGR00245 family protein [Candidatus Atelocyanobacterium thalassa isolate SIO64986]|uniref:TIGR00245 family protein n=1 Tax=Candidatus Atelocyanobacterium thalassa isolate SIO64986 TaxID=1527444 RepID=A0A086CIG5_9CHRO|nr:MAG: TIGR00245 family protein [Candidatus Atelocyanobacterium thalassa isolate SIO64986]